MFHPDDETLALIALGESGPDADHLETCERCQSEVDALRRVVTVGRETQEVRELPPPPDAVWDRIAAATGAVVPPPATGEPTRTHRRRRVGDSTSSPRRGDRPAGPPTAGGPGRARRWARLATTAVAALVVGVAGTLLVIDRGADPPPQACATVRARADLSALPLAPEGAGGEARVLCDGPDRRLHLHVSGLPLQPGYYEVWLIDPDTSEMTAIGQLGEGGDVLLPLASTTDLRKYRLVDISAEQFDNDHTHSGDSLLRGQLTT